MEDDTAGKDPIDRAIESAESFIAFKTREKPVRSEEADGSVTRSLSSSVADPEQSLFLSPADQSLYSEGSAFQWPSNKSASSQVTLPQTVEDHFSPKQSLHALVNKVTDSVLLESPTVETLQKLLQERDKDIEVAAKLGQFLLVRNETLETDLTRTLEQKELLEQQLRHCQQAVVKKDELLRLYATEQQEDLPPSGGVTGGVAQSSKVQTEWLNLLSEECRELRESNSHLQAEADQLKKATAEVEQQEKELMQRCMEQFSEAKKRLSEVREEAEHKDEENMRLKEELECLHGNLEELQMHHEECVNEVEILKEQLTDTQEQNMHMSQQLTDAQLNLEEATVLLKEVREENVSLKEMAADQPASSPADSGHVEHESIVKEIEEVLRKEIIAASTLTERPRSPNNYAQQRAMVVMETVRAATLASSRRQRRRPEKPSPLGGSSPLNASSPKPSGLATLKANGHQHNLSLPAHLSSPASGKGTDQLQEELLRYRQQNYVAPEKLQIVKPMEGSVTLLKWKLLASPQLGGATTYFSDASRPGVHLKKWKAGGVKDIGSLTDQPQGDRNSSQILGGMTGISSLAEGDHLQPPVHDSVDMACSESPLGPPVRMELPESSGRVDVASWLNQSEVTPTSGTLDAMPNCTLTPKTPNATPPLTSSTPEASNSSALGLVGSYWSSSWSPLGGRGSNTTGTPPDSVSTTGMGMDKTQARSGIGMGHPPHIGTDTVNTDAGDEN